ncbi:MAG: pyridoxine 5'-phosphate synthase [Xanthomonadales bacterium]|nr:pyridoxine 5'-phosphate synthase [Xanthomonadales bacterium]
MTRLSINVNKVAVLRNSRGGRLPDVLEAARVALDAGCGGITVHPRPDQRHIRPDDVRALSRLLAERGGEPEFNIEGNPVPGPRGDYPGLIPLLLETRPQQATLVPDGDGQITSDHGWRLSPEPDGLRMRIRQLKEAGIRVSLFMDAGSADIERVAELGADRIELYTGPYAAAHATGDARAALDACARSAALARSAGLGVNAGHDLDQRNLADFLAHVPGVNEVSIGHAVFAEALYGGLSTTVAQYLAIINGDRPS